MTSRMSAPSKLRTTASSVSASRGAEASWAPQGRTQANRTSTRLVMPIPPILTHRPLVIIHPPRHRHHRPHPHWQICPGSFSGEFDADVAAGAEYLGESRLHWGYSAELLPASSPPGFGRLVQV